MIERYEQKIGVTANRQVSAPRFNEVSDYAGRAIGDLGQAFMESQRARVEREVDRAALEDAGVASIVKDENGNYVRPPAPPGGGQRYIETYNKITFDRQANLTIKDTENRLNLLQGEFNDDPAGFLEAAEAYTTSVVENTDPMIRPFVESRLVTEISERQRAVSSFKTQRDMRNLASGESDQAKFLEGQIMSIVGSKGNPEDKKKRVAVLVDDYRKRIGNLVELGEINQDSADAMLGSLVMNAEDAGRKMASFEMAMGKVEPLLSFDEKQLLAIANTAAGIDDPNAPEGYRLTDYGTMEQTHRNHIATQAGQEGARLRGERLRVEQQAKEDARAAAQAAALAAATGKAVSEQLYDYDRDQRNALNKAFDSRFPDQGSFVKAITTPDGQDAVRGFVQQYGILPDRAVQWMETRIWSDGAPAVAELAMMLRNTDTDAGVSMGYKLIAEKLSPKTRAAIDMVERLRRTGAEQPVIMSRIDALLKARMRTAQEVRGAFVDGRQNIYDAVRATRFKEQLGITGTPPRALVEDYDAMMLWNFDIAGGDAREASLITAEQVAAGWVKHPAFLGGVGPKSDVTALKRLSAADLDKALIRKGRGFEYLSFSNGTLRLEPVEIAPHSGKQRYIVHMYSPDGRTERGTYMIDDLATNVRAIAKQRNDEYRAAGQKELQRVRARRDAPRFTPSIPRGPKY